jgi:hypothetical protein
LVGLDIDSAVTDKAALPWGKIAYHQRPNSKSADACGVRLRLEEN